MTELVGDTSLSLIERVREHDPEAWKRLVRLYGPVVFDWCRWQFGLDEHDADDAGQEVLAAVHQAIDGFRRDRDGDTFRGWLWTITRNKVRDLGRTRKNRGRPVGGPDHLERLQNLPEPEAPPDNRLGDENSLCHRALEFIRREFAESSWRAFWRTAIDGQTSREVGEELDMSPEAVRQAKSRVLNRLRRELDGLVDFD